MVAAYDNWGRLTAAVLRREELWQLFHAPSRTPSLSSIASSDLSTTSSLSSSKRLHSSSNLPSPIGFIGGFEVDRRNCHFVCIDNSSSRFDLNDLLDAPWKPIGATYFATTLSNGTTLLSKQWGKKKIAQEWISVVDERLSKLRNIDHENVAGLRGYVFLEDGSVGLYNYFNEGSISYMIHGYGCDWETRVRIAVGTARGLAHIHKVCDGKLVHGNIKASNVFLNSQHYGCLADYELRSLINPSVIPTTRNHGYCDREADDHDKPSQASDVYSFGILLIELLTGKSPTNTSFADRARFHAQDGLSFWVYDIELLWDPIVKQAMWNMLAIAIHCIAKKPGNRPKMSDVVEKLELLLVT